MDIRRRGNVVVIVKLLGEGTDSSTEYGVVSSPGDIVKSMVDGESAVQRSVEPMFGCDGPGMEEGVSGLHTSNSVVVTMSVSVNSSDRNDGSDDAKAGDIVGVHTQVVESDTGSTVVVVCHAFESGRRTIDSPAAVVVVVVGNVDGSGRRAIESYTGTVVVLDGNTGRPGRRAIESHTGTVVVVDGNTGRPGRRAIDRKSVG